MKEHGVFQKAGRITNLALIYYLKTLELSRRQYA